jgi:6-phosphofructokinase 1
MSGPDDIWTENRFVSDDTFVPYQSIHVNGEPPSNPSCFELAGPRARIFFDPAACGAGIVTCGGLCPGLNNVVRSIVLELYYHYGVRRILGYRYGYHGLNPANGYDPLNLDPDMVSDVHESGGTILGTSRGPQDPAVIVENLRAAGINILFTIGGDGTQRGAHRIHEAAVAMGHPLSVIGIPKTIDNDILYVTYTFGFDTAVEEAAKVIDSAHSEARGVFNGVGLVKLMGRDSGFIAAGATVASGEVNYCLVPEQRFDLDGPKGFLTLLEGRMRTKRHAVIVVAEGAGQDLIPESGSQKDASGNIVHSDIGLFLRDRIRSHFAGLNLPVNVRYIDPSYIIRSKQANTHDAILCDTLARASVHAAMSGKSDILIGDVAGRLLHVPLEMVTAGRKKLEPHGIAWGAVCSSTGQPASFRND